MGEKAPSTLGLLTVASAAVGMRGFIRKKLIRDFERAGLNNYVIDTQPESQKHSCTNAQLNKILFDTKISATIAAVVHTSYAAHSFYAEPFIDALALQLSFLPAPLTHSYEGFYLSNKIQKKEWTVIGHGEMQKQETPAMINNLAAQPS